MLAYSPGLAKEFSAEGNPHSSVFIRFGTISAPKVGNGAAQLTGRDVIAEITVWVCAINANATYQASAKPLKPPKIGMTDLRGGF